MSGWSKNELAKIAAADHRGWYDEGVTFEPVDCAINSTIDDAYRANYHGRPYLKPMIGAGARAATVKIMPRNR